MISTSLVHGVDHNIVILINKSMFYPQHTDRMVMHRAPL